MAKMRYGFERFSRNNVLISVLMVVLGAAMLIWPGRSLNIATRILGYGFLAGGAITFLAWLRDRSRRRATFSTLAVAIVLVVLGAAILIALEWFIKMLPRAVGVLVILNGILNLAQTTELRNAPKSSSISSLVMGILTILAGAFLVFYNVQVIDMAVMIVGGILIYNGLSNLWIESRYRNFWR